MPVHELAASIAELPFMDGLFEHGFLLARYRVAHPTTRGTITFNLVAANTFDVLPPKLTQLSGDLFFCWKENGTARRVHTTYAELLVSCVSIERVVGDCERCSTNIPVCFRTRFNEWQLQQPDDVTTRIQQILQQPAVVNNMQEDDIKEFLEEYGEQQNWKFVSPTLTGDAFEPTYRNVSCNQMAALDQLSKERSDRAYAAVETKAALKICREQCIFHDTCDWISSPRYRRGGFDCQHIGDAPRYNYHNRRQRGPYTDAMFIVAREKLLSASEDWLPRTCISQIAANSGLRTRLLGPAMQLVGLQQDMQTVRFRELHSPYTEHTLSFEDAVELCKLPVWEGNSFVYPGFYEPHAVMTDDELLLYYEICQRDYLKPYCHFCSRCEPIIMGIDWRPASKSFEVTGHAGWGCPVNCIQDIEPVFDIFPKVFSL